LTQSSISPNGVFGAKKPGSDLDAIALEAGRRCWTCEARSGKIRVQA
jgi:hypothetical protein